MVGVFNETERIGRVRAKLWNNNEFSLQEIENKTTVITDKDHPEKQQAERVIQEIKNAGINLGEVVYQDNRGEKTDWLVSIILCPSK